jgi:DNA-binding MarR family transcriptional regulator
MRLSVHWAATNPNPRHGTAKLSQHLTNQVDILQEATRLLAGVALRSLDVMDGAVTLPQYRVLAVIADLGAVRSARVAEALGVEPSTITRIIDRLASTGHVERAVDPANRSAVTLRLTSTGRAIVRRVVDWREAELRRMLLALEPGDRAALTRGLAHMISESGGLYGAVAARRLSL